MLLEPRTQLPRGVLEDEWDDELIVMRLLLRDGRLRANGAIVIVKTERSLWLVASDIHAKRSLSELAGDADILDRLHDEKRQCPGGSDEKEAKEVRPSHRAK